MRAGGSSTHLVYQVGSAARMLSIHPTAYAWVYAIPEFIIGSYFSHSNIDWPKKNLRWVATIINTPRVHAAHHALLAGASRKNFGDILSIWDVIFGTFEMPSAAPENFGIDDEKFSNQGVIGQTLHPFKL